MLRLMEMSNVKLRPKWLSSLSKESEAKGVAGFASRWAKTALSQSSRDIPTRLWVDKVAEDTETSLGKGGQKRVVAMRKNGFDIAVMCHWMRTPMVQATRRNHPLCPL